MFLFGREQILGPDVTYRLVSDYDDYFRATDGVLIFRHPQTGKVDLCVSIDVTIANPTDKQGEQWSEVKVDQIGQKIISAKLFQIDADLFAGRRTSLKYFPGIKPDKKLNRYIIGLDRQLADFLGAASRFKENRNETDPTRKNLDRVFSLVALDEMRQQAVGQIETTFYYADEIVVRWERKYDQQFRPVSLERPINCHLPSNYF